MQKEFFQHLTFWETIAFFAGVLLILGWLWITVRRLNLLMHKYTFNKDNNPYRNETLGLPPGTLRAILTLTILIVVVVMVCLSMVIRQLEGTYDQLLTAFELMIAFYFGSKIMSNVSDSDIKQSEMKMQKEVERAEVEARANSSGGTDDFAVSGAEG